MTDTEIMYAWKFNSGAYFREPLRPKRDGWGGSKYDGNLPNEFLTYSPKSAYKSIHEIDKCPWSYEHLTKRGGKCVKIEVTFKEIEE